MITMSASFVLPDKPEIMWKANYCYNYALRV